MNYEKLILELYSRVQVLEEEVRQLKEHRNLVEEKPDTIGTKEIRRFIEEQKESALANGESSLIVKANDLQHQLGIRNRIPSVCNAMRQCMQEGDEILHQSPSGNSTTYEIKYYLK
ncbi:MAG: hypothetical protein IKM48_08460 [Clostridia bacterium]|nr:hypothetical protein [Clostridia bacterium]